MTTVALVHCVSDAGAHCVTVDTDVFVFAVVTELTAAAAGADAEDFRARACKRHVTEGSCCWATRFVTKVRLRPFLSPRLVPFVLLSFVFSRSSSLSPSLSLASTFLLLCATSLLLLELRVFARFCCMISCCFGAAPVRDLGAMTSTATSESASGEGKTWSIARVASCSVTEGTSARRLSRGGVRGERGAYSARGLDLKLGMMHRNNSWSILTRWRHI